MSATTTAPAALEASAPAQQVPAPGDVPFWSVAAVRPHASPAEKRRALVRARLEAWQAADGAARNAERRVDEDTRAALLAGGRGPSRELLAAAVKLRGIALERLQRLRDALAAG